MRSLTQFSLMVLVTLLTVTLSFLQIGLAGEDKHPEIPFKGGDQIYNVFSWQHVGALYTTVPVMSNFKELLFGGSRQQFGPSPLILGDESGWVHPYDWNKFLLDHIWSSSSVIGMDNKISASLVDGEVVFEAPVSGFPRQLLDRLENSFPIEQERPIVDFSGKSMLVANLGELIEYERKYSTMLVEFLYQRFSNTLDEIASPGSVLDKMDNSLIDWLDQILNFHPEKEYLNKEIYLSEQEVLRRSAEDLKSKYGIELGELRQSKFSHSPGLYRQAKRYYQRRYNFWDQYEENKNDQDNLADEFSNWVKIRKQIEAALVDGWYEQLGQAKSEDLMIFVPTEVSQGGSGDPVRAWKLVYSDRLGTKSPHLPKFKLELGNEVPDASDLAFNISDENIGDYSANEYRLVRWSPEQRMQELDIEIGEFVLSSNKVDAFMTTQSWNMGERVGPKPHVTAKDFKDLIFDPVFVVRSYQFSQYQKALKLIEVIKSLEIAGEISADNKEKLIALQVEVNQPKQAMVVSAFNAWIESMFANNSEGWAPYNGRLLGPLRFWASFDLMLRSKSKNDFSFFNFGLNIGQHSLGHGPKEVMVYLWDHEKLPKNEREFDNHDLLTVVNSAIAETGVANPTSDGGVAWKEFGQRALAKRDGQSKVIERGKSWYRKFFGREDIALPRSFSDYLRSFEKTNSKLGRGIGKNKPQKKSRGLKLLSLSRVPITPIYFYTPVNNQEFDEHNLVSGASEFIVDAPAGAMAKNGLLPLLLPVGYELTSFQLIDSSGKIFSEGKYKLLKGQHDLGIFVKLENTNLAGPFTYKAAVRKSTMDQSSPWRIEQDAIEQIVEWANEIGFSTLVKAIEGAESLDILELMKLISSSTTYSNKYEPKHKVDETEVSVGNPLKRFLPFISKGKLCGVCEEHVSFAEDLVRGLNELGHFDLSSLSYFSKRSGIFLPPGVDSFFDGDETHTFILAREQGKDLMILDSTGGGYSTLPLINRVMLWPKILLSYFKKQNGQNEDLLEANCLDCEALPSEEAEQKLEGNQVEIPAEESAPTFQLYEPEFSEDHKAAVDMLAKLKKVEQGYKKLKTNYVETLRDLPGGSIENWSQTAKAAHPALIVFRLASALVQDIHLEKESESLHNVMKYLDKLGYHNSVDDPRIRMQMTVAYFNNLMNTVFKKGGVNLVTREQAVALEVLLDMSGAMLSVVNNQQGFLWLKQVLETYRTQNPRVGSSAGSCSRAIKAS